MRNSAMRNRVMRSRLMRSRARRSRPNPFPPHLLPPRPPAPLPYSPHDDRWWVPPLGFSALALALSAVFSAPLREEGTWPWWWAGYLLPLGMVGRTWFIDRSQRGRQARVRLGVVGCVLTAAYLSLLEAMGGAVFFAMLLTGHVRA